MSVKHDALTDNYEALESQIQNLCKGWSRRRGGDEDELIQESFLYFVRAIDDFDGRGEWAKFVLYRLKMNLLENARRIQHRRACRPIDHNYELSNLMAQPDHRHKLDQLLEELPLDAFVVTHLALAPPPAIQEEIDRKGGTPRNIRSSIRSYLMDLGWSASRVAESYSKVADALREIG